MPRSRPRPAPAEPEMRLRAMAKFPVELIRRPGCAISSLERSPRAQRAVFSKLLSGTHFGSDPFKRSCGLRCGRLSVGSGPICQRKYEARAPAPFSCALEPRKSDLPFDRVMELQKTLPFAWKRSRTRRSGPQTARPPAPQWNTYMPLSLLESPPGDRECAMSNLTKTISFFVSNNVVPRSARNRESVDVRSSRAGPTSSGRRPGFVHERGFHEISTTGGARSYSGSPCFS